MSFFLLYYLWIAFSCIKYNIIHLIVNCILYTLIQYIYFTKHEKICTHLILHIFFDRPIILPCNLYNKKEKLGYSFVVLFVILFVRHVVLRFFLLCFRFSYFGLSRFGSYFCCALSCLHWSLWYTYGGERTVNEFLGVGLRETPEMLAHQHKSHQPAFLAFPLVVPVKLVNEQPSDAKITY